ncbi:MULTISPECIES: DNA polymerase III subunit delta [unclassified Desulfurobacterium]|uniref:DNA polymerase III subunit delta n=1 Tax=Desulfurobacterium sp. TC5-1 TaxID=1158318 RepID=UPI0003B79FEF|nr:DnaA/Hda family protein [Desulfurobacterium sp. TC5-1]
MSEIKAAEFIKKYKKNLPDKRKFLIHGEEYYLTKQIVKLFTDKLDTEKIYVDDENFLNRLFSTESANLFSKKYTFPIVIGIEHLGGKLRKKQDKEKFLSFLKTKEEYLLVSKSKLEPKTLKTELFKKILSTVDTVINATPFDKKSLFSILKKKFKTAGKEIDDETILFIIDSVGRNLQNLKVETDKLICYPGTLTKETVSELLFAAKSGNVFSLIKEIVRNRKREYIENLNLILQESEPLSLIALLQTQMRQIIEVKLGKPVKLPSFVVKEYNLLTRGIPLKTLYKKLSTIHEAEFSIKTGAKKPEEALKDIIFQEER